MKTFFSKLAIAAFAAVSMLAAAAPAKAQTYNQADNIVLQIDVGISQAAYAAAAAVSTGTDVNSKAVADATGVNLGNTSSLSTDINATTYQPNGYGAVTNQVNSLVGQLSDVGSQSATAVANATALASTNATSLAANIGNSATQRAGITSLTH
jgi:hypothetical protein